MIYDKINALIKHGVVTPELAHKAIDSDVDKLDDQKIYALHKAKVLGDDHYQKIADSDLRGRGMLHHIFSEAPLTPKLVKSVMHHPEASQREIRDLTSNDSLPKESFYPLMKHLLNTDDAYGLNIMSLNHRDKFEPRHVEELHAAYPDSAQFGHIYASTKGLKPDTYMKLASRLKKGSTPAARALASNPSLTPAAAMELSDHIHPLVHHALIGNTSLPGKVRDDIAAKAGLDDMDREILGIGK